MRFEDFVGRGAAVSGLCEAFLAGAPSHATLITGPPGIGKRTLAGLCCQSLFCTGSAKPCGTCPGCVRYLAGSHPDAHRIPEKKRIAVDEIRSLNLRLQSAAYEGGYKSVLIDYTGVTTWQERQALNSLLKTLEEPPPRTVFLLTATDAGDLLPTIVSRCRIVRMPPMPADRVEAILASQGTEPGQAAWLAALSHGSIGQALRMRGDEAFWALRDRVLRAMEGVRAPRDVLIAVNSLKDDKDDALLVLDILEEALRGALVGSLRRGEAERAEPWADTLRGRDARSLATLLESLGLCRRMLASNVPWQAALERFLLEYAEVTLRWQS